jgi:tetratricopeptide (TPR) repeat protein
MDSRAASTGTLNPAPDPSITVRLKLVTSRNPVPLGGTRPSGQRRAPAYDEDRTSGSAANRASASACAAVSVVSTVAAAWGGLTSWVSRWRAVRGPIGMNGLPPALHRAIVCVDVEGFGNRRRTNAHQLAIRDGLYRALRQAFAAADVCWQDCYCEDRGDGVLMLVPPEVPKNVLVTGVPTRLAAALEDHNRAQRREARIRLRMAVHAGEVHRDEHGVTGTAINVAFRLLDAKAVKHALAGSLGTLVVIASQWFFEEVIRHDPASVAARYRRVPVSVKETTQIAWICLPDDPYPPEEDAALPPPPVVAVPRQLPTVISGFVGRAAQLDLLTGLLEDAAGASGTVVISAVGGTAGIGKTTLAVYWARRVADRFPDGQLYVNLRGFDPSGSPTTPAEAVRGFLDAFEVPAERIPVSLDAQAALYRSLLAGRRVLVVLDNARDVDQIRPLLPGSPGCVVVVTSRNRLTGLITAEGAYPLTLDLLSAAEASQLLARRIGADRVAAESQAAAEIIAFCARLPLALAIVAARAAAYPAFPLAVLARELRAARGSLDAFRSEDATTDVQAVFSWSYLQLSAAAARLFRLLGLHPGPDVTAPAAASLAGITPGQARSLLAELAQAHLITEHTPGRFTFHDLLRAYAVDQANTHDSQAERHLARHRMLDHYLHTAYTAALRLYSRTGIITLAPPQPGVTPEEIIDYETAWAWFEAELQVLMAAIRLAATSNRNSHAWQLPWTLMDFFEFGGRWHDWAATQRIALAAAQASGDRYGQAHAHRGLGRARNWPGRHDEQPYAHFRQALRLFKELDDKSGQAYIHLELGRWFNFHGRIAEGLAHHQQALALAQTIDDRPALARALNNVGWSQALLGNPGQTLTLCGKALALHREHGNRRSEAIVLDSIGYAHHYLGHHEQAIAYLEQAIALQRKLGDRYLQAMALAHLGDAHEAADNITAAHVARHQALDILDHLDQIGLVLGASPGYPDTAEIRAKLQEARSWLPSMSRRES